MDRRTPPVAALGLRAAGKRWTLWEPEEEGACGGPGRGHRPLLESTRVAWDSQGLRVVPDGLV